MTMARPLPLWSFSFCPDIWLQVFLDSITFHTMTSLGRRGFHWQRVPQRFSSSKGVRTGVQTGWELGGQNCCREQGCCWLVCSLGVLGRLSYGMPNALGHPTSIIKKLPCSRVYSQILRKHSPSWGSHFLSDCSLLQVDIKLAIMALNKTGHDSSLDRPLNEKFASPGLMVRPCIINGLLNFENWKIAWVEMVSRARNYTFIKIEDFKANREWNGLGEAGSVWHYTSSTLETLHSSKLHLLCS